MTRLRRIALVSALLILTSAIVVQAFPAIRVHQSVSPKELIASVCATSNPPTAVASATPSTIEVGGAIHFSAWGSTGDNYIVTYNWNYTNDTGQVYFEGMDAVEWFNDTGNYTVWLVVMDWHGLTNSTSVNVSVIPRSGTNQPPVAVAGPTIWTGIDSEVLLDGSASTDDLSIVVYYWTLDEGSGVYRLFGMQQYYGFGEVGTFPVSLTVIDSLGLTATDTVTVHVQNDAEAGPDQNVTAGQVVTFDASGSNLTTGIVNCSWTFFDQAPVTLFGIIAHYTFLVQGYYVVTLNLINAWGWSAESDTLVVHVLPAIHSPPKAEAGPNATINLGTIYRFNASGSTGDISELDYIWTFQYNGSWVGLYGAVQDFEFDIAGTYVVKLTITDTSGQSANDTVVITVLRDHANGSLAQNQGAWYAIVGSEAGLIALASFVYVIHRKGGKS